VSAEDPGSEENLYDGLKLHSPWTRDFLDLVPGSSGDAQVLQQSSKPTGSQVLYRSGEVALHQSCLLCHGPSVVALQLASPEQLGSQEPLALSRRVPLLVMPLVVCQARTLEAAACSEVPADRQVDGWCSCVRCDGYEPSNI
jgi:hypothetical protein